MRRFGLDATKEAIFLRRYLAVNGGGTHEETVEAVDETEVELLIIRPSLIELRQYTSE